MRRHHLDRAMLECLASVQKLLEHFPNRGVLIGGIAVGLLGEPRATQDVDALLIVDDLREVPNLVDAATELGLPPRISDPLEFAERSRVVLLRHELTGIDVDIALGMLPFEHEIIERRLCFQAEGLSIPLAAPEDLVIMKAVAHRPQDIADIQAIIAGNPELDREHIRKRLLEFSEALDMPEIWEDIARFFENPSSGKAGDQQ